jgi:hypothetical protein
MSSINPITGIDRWITLLVLGAALIGGTLYRQSKQEPAATIGRGQAGRIAIVPGSSGTGGNIALDGGVSPLPARYLVAVRAKQITFVAELNHHARGWTRDSGRWLLERFEIENFSSTETVRVTQLKFDWLGPWGKVLKTQEMPVTLEWSIKPGETRGIGAPGEDVVLAIESPLLAPAAVTDVKIRCTSAEYVRDGDTP